MSTQDSVPSYTWEEILQGLLNGRYQDGVKDGYARGVGDVMGRLSRFCAEQGTSLATMMADTSDRALENNAPYSTTMTDLEDSGELTVRTARLLKREQIYTIGELITKTADDLLGIFGFGPLKLAEVKVMLEARGHHLHRI